MTEKRFIIDDDGIVVDMVDLSMYIDNEDCCEKLNELNDENEQLKSKYSEQGTQLDFLKDENKHMRELVNENKQLKSDNNRLINKTAKVVAEHQGKILDLIDDKIDELEKKYKFGQEVYCGCPMHNIRFGINVLKELKRELQE